MVPGPKLILSDSIGNGGELLRVEELELSCPFSMGSGGEVKIFLLWSMVLSPLWHHNAWWHPSKSEEANHLIGVSNDMEGWCFHIVHAQVCLITTVLSETLGRTCKGGSRNLQKY